MFYNNVTRLIIISGSDLEVLTHKFVYDTINYLNKITIIF